MKRCEASKSQVRTMNLSEVCEDVRRSKNSIVTLVKLDLTPNLYHILLYSLPFLSHGHSTRAPS